MKTGDVKGQRKRHRKNNKHVPRVKHAVYTVDYNPTFQPYMFCAYYQGYLTRNQYLRHKCEKRGCTWLKDLEWAKERNYQ